MAQAAIAMAHDKHPAKTLHEKLGDIKDIELFHNQVLVAVYIRPTKTAGGILLTDKTTGEDEHQSKVGLLIKMGESAFDDPTGQWFKGKNFHLDDWLVFRPSEGWAITVNGVLCRILDDVSIKGRVSQPDAVW